jgi:Tfp pilus assembly protein PilV
MKTKLILLMIVLSVAGLKAQSVEKLIEKYSTNKNFEYVSISKGLFNLTQWLGGSNIDKDTKEVLGRIKSMKILTLNTTNNSQTKASFQQELNNLLKRGSYEQMMETRNKADQSTVYGFTDSKGVAHLLIIVKNDTEMSLIVMKGNLTHEDLEKIAK